MHETKEMPLHSPIALFRTILQAWWRVLSGIYRQGRSFLASLELLQLVFLGASIGIMLFSVPHWFFYTLAFETPRSYSLASDLRLFFFLGGMLGIFLMSFRLPKGTIIYFSYAGLLAALYILGFPRPDWVHSDLANKSDLHFQWHWVLLWGLSLAIALGTAKQALERPILDKEGISQWGRGIARIDPDEKRHL